MLGFNDRISAFWVGFVWGGLSSRFLNWRGVDFQNLSRLKKMIFSQQFNYVFARYIQLNT